MSDTCAKCGSEDIATKYMNVGDDVLWSANVANQGQYLRGDTYYVSDTVTKEHLVKKCRVCGYKWAIPTRDNLPKATMKDLG